MFTKALTALVLVGGLASFANAGQIEISGIGGGVTLNTGPMGPSVFGNDQETWSHASLISAHQILNNAGIATNGKITIVAADTTHGMSLMALFDQDVAGQVPVSMGNVELVTVAHGDNLAYLNSGANNVQISPNGPTSRVAQGIVQWNSNGGGNGFAWAALEDGNSMTWRFNKVVEANLGLMDPSTFQFVNWTGNAWQTIPLNQSLLSFTPTGDYGFSAIVSTIPLPGAGLMGLAGLVGVGAFRRARR